MNDANEKKEAATESDPSRILRDLTHRAQAGDASTLPELRALLANNPGIWREAGDLAWQARRVWLDLLVETDLYAREIIESKLAEMRSELTGPCPSTLENLLIERVLICWLQVYQIDIALAQNQSKPPAVLSELTRRQQAADQRYRAGLKQLLLVQKMRPASEWRNKIKLHDPVAGPIDPAGGARAAVV